jgi:hypothetical protein
VPDEEDEQERLDRELIELLNELRVALPGVQVLFAFLLTVPFTQRFTSLHAGDRRVYFVAVMASALACSFLIAPSAHHRMRFRDSAKESVVKMANFLAIVGFVCLVLGIASTLYLISNALFRIGAATTVAMGFAVFTVILWFGVPLLLPTDRRRRR